MYLTVFVNSTNIYTNIETAMLSSLVTLPTTQCLPKGLVRVTLAFLKITFGKVFVGSARKYFVIGQKSVLRNDGLFVFLLLLRAFPLWGKYYCWNRSRVGAKLQIPSDFPDLSCFSRPRAGTCKNLLSKAKNFKINYYNKIMIFPPAPTPFLED